MLNKEHAAQSQQLKAIKHLVEQFAHCYNTRNLAELLAICSKQTPFFLWGTGMDEVRFGMEGMRDQSDRDWGQSENLQVSFKEIAIALMGNDAAWVACNGSGVVTLDGQQIAYPLIRSTFVACKESEQWKFTHMHFSVADKEQAEGNSFKD